MNLPVTGTLTASGGRDTLEATERGGAMGQVHAYHLATAVAWVLGAVIVLACLAAGRVELGTVGPLFAGVVVAWFVRRRIRSGISVHLYMFGMPGTATITRLRRRGTWAYGASETSPVSVQTWLLIWLRVVPEDPRDPPFEAFVSQGVEPDAADLYVEGARVQVVCDPEVGLVMLNDAHADMVFRPSTLTRLGSMRRANRRRRRRGAQGRDRGPLGADG